MDRPADSVFALRPLRWWPIVLLLTLVFAAAALIAAGLLLNDRSAGALSVSRGCSGGLALAFVLFGVAGALSGLARVVVERRGIHVMAYDVTRTVMLGLVPLIGLVVTIPGAMGCRSATRLADFGSLGDALLGTPGATIAGACAYGIGMAIIAAVRVLPPPEFVAAEVDAYRRAADEPHDVVEAALARHDLLD